MCLLVENVHISRKCVYWIRKCLLKGYNPSYWIYQKVHINQKGAYWPKKCLLNENVPIDRKDVYWLKMCLLNENVSIDRKCAYWMKMCLLTERCLLNKNVFIDRKDAYWKMKSHNYSMFLNVYVALIYVATWRNKARSTKSQTLRLLVIILIYRLVTNPCNAQ